MTEDVHESATVTVPDGPQVRSPYPKARRIRFRFTEDGADDKYFIDGDMVFSHFIAGLSAIFPPGEESFIRSVRRFADQITDPVLKKRVAGFIGQEAVHGQEHRRLNERLVELGYPIAWADSPKAEARRLKFEKRLSPRVHLAMTAAAEHYTAVLAERTLTNEYLRSLARTTETRHLFDWHAFEELEHKSVAFDVYRAVGGTEWTRIVVMGFALTLTVPALILALTVALARDPVARRHPIRVVRQAYALFTGPVFEGLMSELAKYMRRGFHPDDIDTRALLETWREELFGPYGGLTGHLK
ncbi:metal-dependent hydrolase [Mycobacterium sp. pUA109]|uniref:metal-dependent hydrolase n=1 Tax=Mycobacterium sp. pUA109 TaxID=3238982 RepID=UPI00351B52CB